MSLDFSIIIPTHNRHQLLNRCLQKLEIMHYPRNRFEVVVVDDGSSDSTSDILAGFGDKLPLVSLRQPQSGAAVARNRGIVEARGLFCLFIDDDVLAPPDLLRLHRESHGEHFKRLVRGPVINFADRPPIKPPHALWRYFSMNYLCTSNASLRREHLLQAGLFDPSFKRWEDAELGVRLKKLGVRRVFNAEAYVHHWKPPLHPDEQQRIARLDGISAAQLYARYPTLRMYLRSGLHPFNVLKNRWLLRLPRLPRSLRQALQVESAYLQAGRGEMLKGKNP